MFRGHVSFRDTMMRWHDAEVSWRWEMQCIHKRWLLRMQSESAPKSCVRLVLCCMVYVFYAYFLSIPSPPFTWVKIHMGPLFFKDLWREVNKRHAHHNKSPRPRNFKCEANHCPMELFLTRQFNHQTWNLIPWICNIQGGPYNRYKWSY